MKIKVLGLLALSLPCSTLALEPIPNKTGISGFVNLGAGIVRVESSYLAEAGGQDLSDKTINDLGSPDDKTTGYPALAFELGYVFNGKTHLYVGNKLEDFLRFDAVMQLGVRQDVGRWGRVGLAYLTTPLETKVWRDPYLTGERRFHTGRSSSGARINWDNIFGSGFEVRMSTRTKRIDDERSGDGQGLSATDIDSLDREGDINQIGARYAFKFKPSNVLVLGVEYSDYDLDGSAMTYDGASLEANWLYSPNQRLSLVTNFAFGKYDYEADHPLFGDKADKDRLGLGVKAFYRELFGIKNWVANASLAYGDEDSDIGFFDSNILTVSAGFLYRF